MNHEVEPGMLIERDLIVLARHDVGLATDVFRPASGGPCPVLLERNLYDKSAPSRSERTAAVAAPRSRAEVAEYFVQHGYAVVYQDCRGRYKSGGRFTKYLSEAEDGYDTLANADYPHGFAMNLTEGLLRLRYRDSWEQPELMAPGQVYAITIELFPIGNLFLAGHRLRLDISSSNFPHFDVNPNSGEPEGSMEHPRIAENRVFVDRARPSHIILPVVP